ncbi:hypothetical protein PL263_09975 [Methylomonas sp. EFPC3]|uniref:hypothetical protein n=1 Tax=Methylomonas TaxID=416 RepID=UPI0016434202|nr:MULTISPECIES: hypothetical protein [Methylomonas]TPQ25755.1 hypothetical protein C2U68_13690 [Methylomonas koyamae]WFP48447.1 hypothetical protein PL263_09975 [Methylomonas sp. EFPC3]
MRNRICLPNLKLAFVGLTAICLSYSALADEKFAKTLCGGASVEVSAERFPDAKLALSKIVLSASSGKESIRLVFDNTVDGPKAAEYFFAACLKGKDQRSYIVFQNYCGGSGCHDLDNFGIIDAASLRVLLAPSDNNHSLADQIIGHPVQPLFDYKERFF